MTRRFLAFVVAILLVSSLFVGCSKDERKVLNYSYLDDAVLVTVVKKFKGYYREKYCVINFEFRRPGTYNIKFLGRSGPLDNFSQVVEDINLLKPAAAKKNILYVGRVNIPHYWDGEWQRGEEFFSRSCQVSTKAENVEKFTIAISKGSLVEQRQFDSTKLVLDGYIDE